MPTFWQWFFAIIGLVAFIMAAPYILQLFFGQPKIGLVFKHDDSGNEGRIIQVYFMNPPITNRLLKAFKVSRMPAQDIYLIIQVRNVSTGQVVADTFIPEIALSPSSKASRVSLPPSILMASVDLVEWQRATNLAVLIHGDSLIPLQEGIYSINIRIELDGNTKICKPSLLHIGKTETEMIWDKEITGKILMYRNRNIWD